LRTLKKVSLLLSLALVLIVFTKSTHRGVLEDIINKLTAYHQNKPQEKIYLHLDKPFYGAGEDIWFKAYLVNAALHTPDSASRIIYVELLDAKKKLLKRHILYSPDGISHGDFQLGDTLVQGNYLIRAYTNNMKNLGEDFFFVKEFSLVSLKEPITFDELSPDSIDLQFFPEGGNLLASTVESRVAFKATGPDGKSVMVEGEITDDAGQLITTFKSEHAGMGLIKLAPASGKKYKAKITKPYPVATPYLLPAAVEKGYSMLVSELGKNIRVIVFTNIPKAEVGSINLVAQSRGTAYYAASATMTKTTFAALIPKAKLPDGITQITLFDGNGVPQCERLVYVNHNESLDIRMNTAKAAYGKRELVELDIEAFYKDRSPASGNFSVSVYNTTKVESPEQFPMTIENYLSLTSDLKGYIENPGYYLKDSLQVTKGHLDLLMMTHGWRRFTWKEVLSDNQSPLQYNYERGIPISGDVGKVWTKGAAPGITVKIMTLQGDLVSLESDSAGRFYTDDLLYYDSTDLVVQTESAKGSKKEYKFNLDPFNPSPQSFYDITSFKSFDVHAFMEQRKDRIEAESSYRFSNAATLLKEVEVKDKKLEENKNRAILYGKPDQTIQVSKLAGGYTNVLQSLQGRVAGVSIDGLPPEMTARSLRGGETIYLLDGARATAAQVATIPASFVESIDILRGGQATVYGAGLVISINLKDGAGYKMKVGMSDMRYPGLYKAREFYSPRYDVPDNRHAIVDKRLTVFWSPLVETDSEGMAKINFYTPDEPSSYAIVIEGITPDGFAGHKTISFSVQ
jgi:hypothetical protein